MSSTKTKLLDSAQKNLLKGQFARAISDYRQIIQMEPSDMRHRQKLAEILTKANQKDEAVNEYTSLAKHYIDSVHYLKAIAVYKQIQKLDPTNPDISLTLGSLNEKQGLIGNATAEYASALQIYETNGENLKALKVLESMLSLDPGNSAVRLRIAEKNFSVGKENDSFNEFIALATDLKNRNDENGFMHVSERIHHLFKEREQDILSLLGGEEQTEPEPEQIAPPPVQASTVQSDHHDDLTEEIPETVVSFVSAESEESIEDIPLLEELEDIEDTEEFSVETDEPEWEEDIDLDLSPAAQGADESFIRDAEEDEEPEPEVELEELEVEELEVEEIEELELDDIELVLELEDEEREAEPPLSEPATISHSDRGFSDSPFDLAGELSTFADEIDFDMIKTSSSDSQFTLDTASGFKRNELDNEDAESHYSLGLAYKEMGLFDEAISEFLVASKSDERKIDSLILTAVCFRELGKTEMAVEILSDTLKLPDIKDDELLGVKYELAICREVMGEIPLARQLYTEIITVRPDFSDTASRIAAL